jgi:hypothetical protein
MVALADSFSGWDGKTVYSGFQPSTLPSQTPFGASRIGTNTLVWSAPSGKSYNTVMSYTGLMQTQGYGGGQHPVNGVTPLSGSNLGFSGVAFLDEPLTPDGLYDTAIQGSSFRLPGRSFTNIGPNVTSDNNFKDVTFFLDQQVGRTVNLQLSGGANRQRSLGMINYFTNQGYPNTFIDINRLLPDGTSNPNFLKPYNEFSRQERQINETDNRAIRLAGAYVDSFRWVDIKANLIGAIENTENFRTREYFMLPADPDPRQWGLATSALSQTIRYRYYWDQLQREIPEFESVNVVDPVAGTSKSYNPLWVLASDRADATILSKSKVNYFQGSTHLAFFKKRLILLGAYRSDSIKRSQEQFLAAMDHAAGASLTRDNFRYRPTAPADYWQLRYTPKSTTGVPTAASAAAVARPRDATGVALPQYSNDRFLNDYNPPSVSITRATKAVGSILNVGWGFSLWANYAQTFNPANLGSTTIDYGTPESSVSNGLDYGVRLSFGPKFYLTLSRFDSSEANAAVSQPSGFSNIAPIIATNAVGDLNAAGRNARGLGDVPTAWTDQIDREASGYELEMVANLTRNWRATVNFGTSDAAQTNAYRQTRAWVDSHATVLRQILDDAGIQIDASNLATAKPGVTTATSPDLTNGINAWNGLMAARANWITGRQPLNRLTKYTANFFTDYRFSRGLLSGLRFGYGMQFRGKQVIGFRGADTIVNPANPLTAIDDPAVSAIDPIYQKAYFLATGSIGYPLKLSNKLKFDLNLTISNLLDYDDPLFNTSGLRATNANLASPARVSVGRGYSYVTPRSFRLSATYGF